MITQKVPPGPSKLMEDLSNIGYDLNTAIADIIDNSIYWGAKNINVEIIPEHEGTEEHILICDDGIGMNEERLVEGMRYASERDYKKDDLGKFGLGLKAASLSQCDILTVYTKAKKGTPLIARWDKNFVREKREWLLQRPVQEDLIPFEKNIFLNLKRKQSGTTVCLTRLIDFAHLGNINKKENKILHDELGDDLLSHIGMVYHEIRKVKIKVQGIDVSGWDPFCRTEKVRKLKTENFLLKKNTSSRSLISIDPFILPRKDEFSSNESWKEASGPKKWNNQQGFYFYRNGRLIKSGGWANCKGRIEEHNKLLRVMINFKSNADKAVQVNIAKSQAIIPLEIRANILEKLKKWRGIAAQRYNSGKKTTGLKRLNVNSERNKILFKKGEDSLEIKSNKLTISSNENMIIKLKAVCARKSLRISQITALYLMYKFQNKNKKVVKAIINEK